MHSGLLKRLRVFLAERGEEFIQEGLGTRGLGAKDPRRARRARRNERNHHHEHDAFANHKRNSVSISAG